MSKYIIKNCDNYTNFDEDWTCRSTIQNRKGCYCCKDITDCVMKRIVEITKGYEKACGKHCDKNRKENNCGKHCNAYKIRQILELLEIEEVDD